MKRAPLVALALVSCAAPPPAKEAPKPAPATPCPRSAETPTPESAGAAFHRGYELTKIAEATPDRQKQKKAYEDSKTAFRTCLQQDPRRAECHHFLGEAALATGDPQTGIDEYAEAIRIQPNTAYFYAPLGDALIALQHYDTALGVLDAGIGRITVDEHTRSSLYAMHVLCSQAYQAKGDPKGMLRALEAALAVDADGHPEIYFELGAAYAVQDPPIRDRALERLIQFSKRVCHGAFAAKFKDQCDVAQSLIQKLGPER